MWGSAGCKGDASKGENLRINSKKAEHHLVVAGELWNTICHAERGAKLKGASCNGSCCSMDDQEDYLAAIVRVVDSVLIS